ncbi:MAG: hypothetical protein L0207_05115 [Chlamydiae bacterium]|nr:hypothetical protein [Chlamydiota bacterium]
MVTHSSSWPPLNYNRHMDYQKIPISIDKINQLSNEKKTQEIVNLILPFFKDKKYLCLVNKPYFEKLQEALILRVEQLTFDQKRLQFELQDWLAKITKTTGEVNHSLRNVEFFQRNFQVDAPPVQFKKIIDPKLEVINRLYLSGKVQEIIDRLLPIFLDKQFVCLPNRAYFEVLMNCLMLNLKLNHIEQDAKIELEKWLTKTAKTQEEINRLPCNAKSLEQLYQENPYAHLKDFSDSEDE